MPPSQQTRINLNELTAKLKGLGPDKESQYFSLFSRFLSRRLSKAELQRQVVLTIGREYVALHNQLIKAIVHNASGTEPPLPPPVTDTTSKPVKGIKRKPVSTSDEAAAAARSNGDMVVASPRKNRTSGVRKTPKERHSLLGFVKPEELGGAEDPVGNNRIQGRAGVDFLRPVQHIQDAAEQPDTDSLGSVTKRPRLIIPAGQPDSPGRGGVKTSPSEDALDEQPLVLGQQQQQQQECTLLNTWPVRPPLGTPFCVGSVGAAQRQSHTSVRPGFVHHHQQQHLTHSLLGDSIDDECLDAGDSLPDGDCMRRRMERISNEQGIQGVSPECAHLLNQALDIHLKRLIAASVGFVQSRRSEKQQQQQQQQPASSASAGGFDQSKVMLQAAKLSHVHGLNGVWPGSSHPHHHQQQQLQQHQHQHLVSSSSVDVDPPNAPVSVLEFKMTMDSNTKLLGENRSAHLERILLRVFEQQQRQVLH